MSGENNKKSEKENPEVKVPRRIFSAKEKLEVLTELDEAKTNPNITAGEILRRRRLYSSTITRWRRERDEGALEAMGAKGRGRQKKDPLTLENRQLKTKISALESKLEIAEELIEAQGKVSALLQNMSAKSAETQ